MCADCPDQSCPACQLRLQDAHAYDQLAVRAPAAEQPPGRSPQPRPASRPAPPIRPARRGRGGRPVTIPGRTPDEPGTRRQADGPLVPAQRPADKDMREMHDPYDLPFPDYSDRWPPRRPEYVIVVDQLRDWQPRRATVPGRAPGNRHAPANPSPTWKPNHDPDPEGRHDPDHQRHHHDQRPDRPHRPARTRAGSTAGKCPGCPARSWTATPPSPR